MDVRKLWDNADDKSQYKNVCDVYGAEHLARLIGIFASSHVDFAVLTWSQSLFQNS